MNPRPEVHNALKKIKLLVLDVDGVLTDGGIIFGADGCEIKTFNVKDGLGIRLLVESGIEVCIATGRTSESLRHRCRELRIPHVLEGLSNKTTAVSALAEKLDIAFEQMAFIGDDLPDLALMQRVGLPVAVADAHPLIKKTAMMTTQSKGGKGAVREVCECLLQSRNLWEKVLKRFSDAVD